MSSEAKNKSQDTPASVKDLATENPRWCVGCGDFGILMGLKRFIVDTEMSAAQTVNVSGIGCSGRAPNYIHTYGVHSIHGRAITVALGLALARPDLNVFVHSGDGDALSIGGNHLIHGINKNFNCVFMLYDNELYALTKSQTSPTTRQGHQTNTQPSGTYLAPLNAIQLALGAGASFLASTADWMPDHLTKTLKAASFTSHSAVPIMTPITSITRHPAGSAFSVTKKGFSRTNGLPIRPKWSSTIRPTWKRRSVTPTPRGNISVCSISILIKPVTTVSCRSRSRTRNKSPAKTFSINIF